MASGPKVIIKKHSGPLCPSAKASLVQFLLGADHFAPIYFGATDKVATLIVHDNIQIFHFLYCIAIGKPL